MKPSPSREASHKSATDVTISGTVIAIRRCAGWGALALMVCIYNLPRLLWGTVQFDGVDVHYSAQRYLSEELHAGRLPFWTPYVFTGFPFLADLQVAAWYPLNWPFFLAGITPGSINGELLLDHLVACFGAYALGRRLFGSTTPALAAAIFYGLSGWFAAHSQHVGMVDTVAWLPWLVLVLLDMADRGVSPSKLLQAGLLGAAIALPGHFQTALYTFSFVGVWTFSEAALSRSWRSARRVAAGLAAAAVWGGLLSAVMILPSFELVGQSVRARLDARGLPDIGFFHPGSLLTLVDPDYYGLLSGPYHGPGDSTQHYFYAGILLLPLALVGLRNARVVHMAALLGLPFLWYTLGPSGGLYRLMARLPGFSSVELPMHGWFLPALGLALLGGAGVAYLERRAPRPVTAGALLFILVDVLVVNQLLNPLAYTRRSFDELYGASLRSFQTELEAARPPVERLYGPELAQVGYRNHALQSRVETTYGYNPLELAAYADYANAAEVNPRLIGGFAVSHGLTPDGHVEPITPRLPVAYYARSVVSVPDDASARDALHNLDPARATLLIGITTPVDPGGTVTVVSRSADSLVLHFSAASSGLLRVAVPFYPGWHASLDGQELPITPVDLAFTGVVVPAGEGDLYLDYAPRLFGIGAAVSLLALAASVVAAVIVWRRRQ